MSSGPIGREGKGTPRRGVPVQKRAVRGGERTCRESLVERPCVKEKDTGGVIYRRMDKQRRSFLCGYRHVDKQRRSFLGWISASGRAVQGAAGFVDGVRRRVEPSSFVVVLEPSSLVTVRVLASESALSAAGPCA